MISLGSSSPQISVALISPMPPPYGGMAIQAQKLEELLLKNGISTITIPTNQQYPKPIEWVQKIPMLRTMVNTVLFLFNINSALSRVDVIYFMTCFYNFFFWITFPALILIKLRGKKIILSAHGGTAGHFFNRYRPILKALMKKVDLVVTPSEFLKKPFKDNFGITPVVVPNIADLSKFIFKPQMPLRPNLLVSRNLESMYNVSCVIRAFEIVHRAFPESKLGIAGDGSERKKLEQLARELSIRDSITFYGQIKHSRMHQIYEKYDIFINASNVDNLPGTIVEAFASGLPVISTAAGGIPFMVKHGQTGILVKKNDHKALARGVIKLLKNPGLAQALVHNGNQECRNYSLENVENKLIPILLAA